MKQRKPFLIRKRTNKQPTLLDIRKKELSIARLDLIRYEDLARQKPRDSKISAERDRYKSRIECLELAVMTLERIGKE